MSSIGERTGKTAEPTDVVSKAMRTAKDSNGERLFAVMAIFSRASKLVVTFLALLLSVEVDQPDSEDEIAGEDLQNVLRDKVLSEVSIQHSHPIVYDSFNICGLVINSKLGSLSVLMLWIQHRQIRN